MQPLTIRPATEADLTLLEWGGRFWKYRNLFRKAYQSQCRGACLMLLADQSDYPVGRIFVQFEIGNPVYVDGHERGYLYSLHVMHHLRGRGIGTRLIEVAEAALLEREFSIATIAVAKDNPGARRLYERLGYVIFGFDHSSWGYTDPDGHYHRVHEPSWRLKKLLTARRVE